MALFLKQRDLVVTLKKETVLNIEILSKIHPRSHELNRLIHKDNWLEKPTQNLFNHLTHYLVNIIEHHAASSLTWPLYDTNSERAYRNEFSNFINSYSSKGLLTPVMSSYLVNPACYKVTMLIFQLSQLAIQSVLTPKMIDRHETLYNNVTGKYKNKDKGFIEYVENETQIICEKIKYYLNKRKTDEKIAELLSDSILKIKAKLEATNSQKYIDNLVDTYISKNQPNEQVREKLLEIKDVLTPCSLFDIWLTEADNKITELESNWDSLITPLLISGRSAVNNSRELIGRRMGEIDRNLFVVEYNSQTDSIPTFQLQQLVNSEQKYILKNIEKDGRLNYPNLIRSFLIAICYILKTNEIGNDIDKFNNYLNDGVQTYSKIKSEMKMLNERVLNAESKLPVIRTNMIQSQSLKKSTEIPPIPDLSILKTHTDKQFLFENFTPMRLSKHEFNLRRKPNLYFNGPQTKSLTTLFSISRDDYLKSRMSCRLVAHDNPNATQNFQNFSLMSYGNKVNETIAECSSGFTTQQITRLLSTKKTSSSKKFKNKTERPDTNIKKGCLFNESVTTESGGLFRCHSSPNLFENIERKPLSKLRPRKLSIMQEDSPNSLLEVSGIAMLDRNSNCNTPQSIEVKKQNETSQQIVPVPMGSLNQESPILKSVNFNVDTMNGRICLDNYNKSQSPNNFEIQSNNVTPKTNGQLIAKSNSLEKIINRYKKVRAVAVSSPNQTTKLCRTIVEEKENSNIVHKQVSASSILPDIVNATPNSLPVNPEDWFLNMDAEQIRRTRQSLGTVLGVDHTFLDTCEFID